MHDIHEFTCSWDGCLSSAHPPPFLLSLHICHKWKVQNLLQTTPMWNYTEHNLPFLWLHQTWLLYVGILGSNLTAPSGPHRSPCISDQSYYVQVINSDAYSFNIYRNDKWSGNCPDALTNTAIDHSKFNFTSADQNITFFYNCAQSDYLRNLAVVTNCTLGSNGSVGGILDILG